ncbi:uncharacterized protein LOC125655293 [Ostrea edulis]|uniref:uncharacterized protein LOC125655293 n=1 Tax=Ostrea edulis TaxID=37623 RepID=UPI0020957CCB|nr:uncharacterized protein LOC125655293 [Ostrea edulis]
MFWKVCVLCMLGVAQDVVSMCHSGMWKTKQTDCSSFSMCVLGKSVEFKCPGNTVANQMMQACVPAGSYMDICSEKQSVVDEKTPPMIEKPLDPKPMVQKPQTNPYTDMCRGAPSALLPHPDSCAKHIDCSKVMQGMMGEFECPFPTLWNSETKRCDSPLNVKCGTRWEPKDACEYESNACKHSSHCIPCEVRFPSCKGRADGINSWSGREWTPHFVVCENERLVHQGQCTYEETSKIVFDPVEHVCIRL